MRVFASRFLEEPQAKMAERGAVWTWEPHDPEVPVTYASGRPTGTNASTYNAETDNHGDTDRPDEGMLEV
jgi:hypothetical protein